MLTELLSILSLSFPTLYQSWDSRKGDRHPNNDWKLWIISIIVIAGIVDFFNQRINYIQAVVMAGGIAILLFPYLTNILQMRYIRNHKIKWWDHMSATAWPDRVQQWRELNWMIRLLMIGILFSGCLKLYLCWGKFLSFDNNC